MWLVSAYLLGLGANSPCLQGKKAYGSQSKIEENPRIVFGVNLGINC
jgi:hypothetical protein